MSNPRPQATVVTGKAAMDVMLEVYLDGFVSGASTVLATLLPEQPEALRDEYAQQLIDTMRRDPLAMDLLVTTIGETLAGTDSGPKNLRIQQDGGRS